MLLALGVTGCLTTARDPGHADAAAASPRSRISVDDNWRFTRGDSPDSPTNLLYDARPAGGARRDAPPATNAAAETNFAKAWILPTANAFLKIPADGPKRPAANLGGAVAYARPGYDDTAWKSVDLPHDYAIEGPFTTSGGGGMGRLPTAGVAWYRKALAIPASGQR